MSPASSTWCGVHPKAPAVDVCTRCGTFVCFECVDGLAGSVYCTPCMQKLSAPRAPEPASLRSQLAFGFAVAGFLLFPLAVVAIALGLVERWLIHRGRAPPAGERYARLATTLGVYALVCTPILLLLFATRCLG